MQKQTLSSTALKTHGYRSINQLTLEAVRQKLGLESTVREAGDELLLPLSDEICWPYFLGAKVCVSREGIPRGFIRLGCAYVGEGRQEHTWSIEQLVQGDQGNVVFVTYRLPYHSRKLLPLTLDEDLRPDGVSVNVGKALLLPHLLEVIKRATK